MKRRHPFTQARRRSRSWKAKEFSRLRRRVVEVDRVYFPGSWRVVEVEAGKRVLALASVRHDKSSPLISAQERRNPMSKARILAVHWVTECISQVPPGIHEPQNKNRQIWKLLLDGNRENSSTLRRYLDATSPDDDEAQASEIDCSQNNMMT